MDVHRAIESRLLDFQVAGVFQFALSLERGNHGEAALVLHSTACTVGCRAAEAKEYLRQFGLIEPNRFCPYFYSGCQYKILRSTEKYFPGFELHSDPWSGGALKAIAEGFDADFSEVRAHQNGS